MATQASDLKTAIGDVQRGIDHFRGLPHRLEFVGRIEGIDFYNDSKATNVDAAVRSIASFDGPVILIAGGRHKGGDYSPLVHAAEGKVRAAIFLGEAKDPWGNVRAGFETTTTLNRQDFGVSWNAALDQGGGILGDEVTININLEAIKQKEIFIGLID